MSADPTLGQVLIVALFILPAALQQRRAGSARNLDAAGVAAGTMQWMTGTCLSTDTFPFVLAPSEEVVPGRGTRDSNMGVPGVGAGPHLDCTCPTLLGRRDPVGCML